jgi:hypothetical protein
MSSPCYHSFLDVRPCGQRQPAFGISVVLLLFGWQPDIPELSTSSELQPASHDGRWSPLVTPGLHPDRQLFWESAFDKYFRQYSNVAFFCGIASGRRRDLNRWLDPQFVTGFFYRPLGFYRRVAVTVYTAVYR